MWLVRFTGCTCQVPGLNQGGPGGGGTGGGGPGQGTGSRCQDVLAKPNPKDVAWLGRVNFTGLGLVYCDPSNPIP